MIFLSFVMLYFVAIGFLSYFNDDPEAFKSDRPFLTSGRDETQDGAEFIANRMKNAPLLYGTSHILPAAIWSLLIPTQHFSYIKRNFIQFHRISGWLIVLSTVSLNISGLLFPLYNLSYSDPDLFHVHYLLIPTQLLPFISSPIYLPFPTTNLQIKFAPLVQLFPLYKAIQAIRVERNVAEHKRWMILHTIGGYLISIERVVMLLIYAFGFIVASLPKDLEVKVASALHFPDEKDEIKRWEIERSAFSFSVWVAFIASIAWVWNLTGKNQKAVKSKDL